MTRTDMHFVRRFGSVVRQLRQERGWSQDAFADKCGLHRTYIGAVERGEKNVTLQTALKLAIALQVTLAQLVMLAEDTTS